MITFIENLGTENIVYGVVALAGLIATVYCTFFSSSKADKDNNSMDTDTDYEDDNDSSDD